MLSSMNSEDIRKYDCMEVVVISMQAKKEHPDYKKSKLCALISVSESYLKRVMKDLYIKSFYRHYIPVNVNRRITHPFEVDRGKKHTRGRNESSVTVTKMTSDIINVRNASKEPKKEESHRRSKKKKKVK